MLKKDSVAVTSQPAAESKPTVSASPPKCAEIQKITKTLNILNISTPPTTQQSDSPKPNVASPFNTHNVSPFNMRAPPFETRHNKALSVRILLLNYGKVINSAKLCIEYCTSYG